MLTAHGLNRGNAAVAPAEAIAKITELLEAHPGFAAWLEAPGIAALTLRELARRHLQPIPSATPPPGFGASLSVRELDVTRLIVEGLSNKEIGARLHLSDNTIKNHVSHILAKLRLKARTQIAVLALRGGLRGEF